MEISFTNEVVTIKRDQHNKYNIQHWCDIDLALFVLLFDASFHDPLFMDNQLISNFIGCLALHNKLAI